MNPRPLRLFVGLALPPACQEGLRAMLPALRREAPGRASWTSPGDWHLTLKFLGDAAQDAVAPRCAALGAIVWKPFALRVAGGGCFPCRSRPRVLWAGVSLGEPECRRLAGQVEQAVRPLGFAPESRPFAAHLTIARVRPSARGPAWSALVERVLAAPWPEVVMDTMVLWRSMPADPGQQKTARPRPRYLPMGEFGARGRTVGGNAGPGEPATGNRPD